jgi:CRP/FNR family nitrogen fixation transcriptional regulator
LKARYELTNSCLTVAASQSATERVGAFLLEMNGRLTMPDFIALPMTRRDIADYLGLTVETVSRAISAYQRKGFLKVAGPMQRDIIVLNPAGLTELDRSCLSTGTLLARE